MRLLLALRKKRMRVKIKIKPRCPDQAEGQPRAVSLWPTTPVNRAHGLWGLDACLLDLQPWGLLYGVVGWEAGSVNSRF